MRKHKENALPLSSELGGPIDADRLWERIARFQASRNIRDEYITRAQLVGLYSVRGDADGAISVLPSADDFDVAPRDDCSPLFAEWLTFNLGRPDLAGPYVKRALRVVECEDDPKVRRHMACRLLFVELEIAYSAGADDERMSEIVNRMDEQLMSVPDYVENATPFIRHMVASGRLKPETLLVLRACLSRMGRNKAPKNTNTFRAESDIQDIIQQIDSRV